MADGLMTDQEFDAYLRNWAMRVQMSAVFKLMNNTHSTGQLASSLKEYVDKMRDGIGRHIAFRFPQYGVFRAYGAGRGWVVIGGKPVKGYRVLSQREIREHKTNTLAQKLLQRGWKWGEVKKAKIADTSIEARRRALDWIDGEIKKRQDEVADWAVAFFGDKALEGVLREIDKSKIVKSTKI